MKTVRIQNGVVFEIIPDSAVNIGIAHCYGSEFASQCVEAPDNVQQNYIYNITTNTFSVPSSTIAINDLRTSKISEISIATKQTIFNGIDVTTAYGNEHFTLVEDPTNGHFDQTNITNLGGIGTAGKSWLYHASDGVCKKYTAADLIKISSTALLFVTQNTTYYNLMVQWINRETNINNIQGITFGVTLPTDLNTQLNTLINSIIS
jgi:hypothetical protein